jgi:hypothetical protein
VTRDAKDALHRARVAEEEWDTKYARMLAALDKKDTEIARLRSALEDCADACSDESRGCVRVARELLRPDSAARRCAEMRGERHDVAPAVGVDHCGGERCHTAIRFCECTCVRCGGTSTATDEKEKDR